MSIERLLDLTPEEIKRELGIKGGESPEQYTARMGRMIDQAIQKRAKPFGGADHAEDFIKERLPHYSDKGGHKERSPR